jgi:D-alanyl-D-alanine carboxypeptidase
LAFAALAAPLNALALPDAAFFANLGAEGLATGAAPGAAMAVVSHGRIVYEGGFGFADIATHATVTAGTRFAIGSLTKQFTAAAIELLADRGKLSVDDRLAKYVPSLPNSGAITLRMLLDQTSGLHNYPKLTEHDWPLSGSIATSSVLAILASDKPDFAPGLHWEYSNANYAALAAVVENVAGMPLGDFLTANIFAPLGMRASGFGYAAQAGIAVGYAGKVPETPPLSLDLFSGAGAAISSAHDLALWDLSLLDGKLFSQSYLERVWSDGVATGQGSERYANGWVLTRLAGHRELWHNGLAPQVGGYCFNAIFPDDGLAVVVLTNGFAADGLPERMTQSIAAAYGIGAAPVAAAVTPAPNDNAAIDALVRGFWDQLATGTVDRKNLTAEFSAALTPALVAQVSQSIAILGPLRELTFIGTLQGAGVTIYRYSLSFATGTTHEWDVAITSDRKIAGSRLVR